MLDLQNRINKYVYSHLRIYARLKKMVDLIFEHTYKEQWVKKKDYIILCRDHNRVAS